MNGWQGKVLHINLGEKTFRIEEPDKSIYLNFLGGKGLCSYYLSEYFTDDINSENMPVTLFTGPLTDTISPSCTNICISGISPLTGTVGYNTAGGSFGRELKRCGFDGIVITGKASKIKGIEILDGKVSFIECEKLKDIKNPELKDKLLFDGAILSAGPAAFSGVLFSSLAIDGNIITGRNGLGFSFAEKNIKYIAAKGKKKTAVKDIDSVESAMVDIKRLISASPILKGDTGIGKFGTFALFDLISSRRMIPTDNFRKTFFEDPSSINSYSYREKFGYLDKGSEECIVKCGKITEKGREIPGYETIAHFSALLMIRDMDAVLTLNEICIDYGMDPLSAAATISCFSEIHDRKLSSDEIISILVDIGEGKSDLKKGSFRYAEQFGKKEMSMSVKKQEIPAYDPRGAYGMALSYATSVTGACHLSAYPVSHEILRKPVATDRFSFSGKARIVKISEDINASADSLFICRSHLFAASLEEYSKVYNSVTGDCKSAQDLIDCGERINYSDRILNKKLGITNKDDDLPSRFFTEEGSGGNNIEIAPLNREEFLDSRDRYYRIRGLDENGLPVRKKAEQLGLKWKNY